MQVKNVWKVIPIATFRSLSELVDALEEARINIGWRAGKLLEKIESKFAIPTTETPVSVVTNKTLGLEGSIPVKAFYREAMVKGYKLCTPELGLLARLAYTSAEQIEQPSDMWWICIAMEPILLDDGKSYIFRIAAGTRGARFDAAEVDDSTESETEDNWLFQSPE